MGLSLALIDAFVGALAAAAAEWTPADPADYALGGTLYRVGKVPKKAGSLTKLLKSAKKKDL
jgi:hypothetical protein